MPDPISSLAPKSREGAASSTSTYPCTKMPRTPDVQIPTALYVQQRASTRSPCPLLPWKRKCRRFQPRQSAPTKRTGKRRRCPAEYLNHGKARSSTKELSDLLVASAGQAASSGLGRREQPGPTSLLSHDHGHAEAVAADQSAARFHATRSLSVAMRPALQLANSEFRT